MPANNLQNWSTSVENQNDVGEKILSLICEAMPRKRSKSSIRPETNLQKELGLDSIAIAMFVFRFEQTFNVDVTKTSLKISMDQLKTVRDAINIGMQLL